MKKILVVNTIYKEKGGEDTNIVDEVNFIGLVSETIKPINKKTIVLYNIIFLEL